MPIHECNFGDCENVGEFLQTFGRHKVVICPLHRIQAYKLSTHFGKVIKAHEVRSTIEFYTALKQGEVPDE